MKKYNREFQITICNSQDEFAIDCRHFTYTYTHFCILRSQSVTQITIGIPLHMERFRLVCYRQC